jgi:prepilin-type N-terminal cleavage/methylation domain-containing protein
VLKFLLQQSGYRIYNTGDIMRMNNYKGVTLIELMVVMSIIGILMIILGFSYWGWMGSYKVESQTKDIYTDLMNARARAMNRNRTHFLNFPNATSYEVYEDTNDAGGAAVIEGDGQLQTASDTRLPAFPRTLEYAVTIGTAGVIPFSFSFNNRGMLSPERTICIFTDFNNNITHLPPSDGISDVSPDYDCIILSETRIIMGQVITQNTAGGTCVSANCRIK